MQKIFLSDFLLGKKLNTKSEFFATFPSLINDLKEISLNKDSFGNFVFSNINKQNEIITQIASSDIGIGNLILILKQWIKKPKTYVIKNKNTNDLKVSDFCGYLRHDPILIENNVIENSFIWTSKKDDTICYVGFNKNLELFYYRSSFQTINIPSYLKEILQMINFNENLIVLKKDKIKEKYKNRFSDSEYSFINH